MPNKKAARLKPGDTVNGWRVVAALADYVRPDRRITTQRYRVTCTGCSKTVQLKRDELERLNCLACAKAATAATAQTAALDDAIRYAFRVHLKICGTLQLAPTPWETFEREARADPDDYLQAPAQREPADYEQRNYTPLYSSVE